MIWTFYEMGMDVIVFSVIYKLRTLGFDLSSEIIWVEQIIICCHLGWEERQFRWHSWRICHNLLSPEWFLEKKYIYIFQNWCSLWMGRMSKAVFKNQNLSFLSFSIHSICGVAWLISWVRSLKIVILHIAWKRALKNQCQKNWSFKNVKNTKDYDLIYIYNETGVIPTM